MATANTMSRRPVRLAPEPLAAAGVGLGGRRPRPDPPAGPRALPLSAGAEPAPLTVARFGSPERPPASLGRVREPSLASWRERPTPPPRRLAPPTVSTDRSGRSSSGISSGLSVVDTETGSATDPSPCSRRGPLAAPGPLDRRPRAGLVDRVPASANKASGLASGGSFRARRARSAGPPSRPPVPAVGKDPWPLID